MLTRAAPPRSPADAVVDAVAARVADIRREFLPPDVGDRAQALLLHALVVGLAGARTRSAALARAAVGDAGPGRCTVLGVAEPAVPTVAAFVNGAVMHARVQEDTLGTAHPGPVVVSALLAALADGARHTGPELLAALVAGYETIGALGGAIDAAGGLRPGLRATSVLGPAGAAVAVTALAGADDATVRQAIAHGVTLAGGLTQGLATGSDDWPLQAGWAAMSGLLAAGTAQAGGVGAASAVEGPHGLLRACTVAPPGAVETSEGATRRARGAAPPDVWWLRETTSKDFPVAAFNQAPVLAALQLRAAVPGLASCRAITVELAPAHVAYPGIDRDRVHALPEALMSTRHCVAVALAEGHAGHATLTPPFRPGVEALADRVRLDPDPGRRQCSARVTVTDAEGCRHHADVDWRDGARWSFAQAVERCSELRADVPPGTDLDGLAAAVRDLPWASTCGPLVRVLGTSSDRRAT